jgi:hypothetical protein
LDKWPRLAEQGYDSKVDSTTKEIIKQEYEKSFVIFLGNILI